MRRMNLIQREVDQLGESSEWDDDNIVVHVNGVRVKPFLLKKKDQEK